MPKSLSDICDYINEKTFVNKLSDENYISTDNMLSNKSGIVKASTLPNTHLTPAYQKNDILISNIRPYFKKIWQAKCDGGCSNDVLVLRAKQSIHPKFLYYVLSEDKFFEYASATAKGTKMPRGDKVAIMKYEVSEFSELEQRKIASILSALDDKIELNNQINNNLEQQAQALIEDYQRKTEMTSPLGNLLSFINGFAFKSSDYLIKGTYKIITIKNVQDGLVDSLSSSCLNNLPDKLPNDCKLNIGDVLLSLTGNVGRVGIVTEDNLLLNQRVAKVKSKNQKLLPFIYFMLRYPSIKTKMENISKGTAQQNLSPVETLKLQIHYNEELVLKLSEPLSSMFNQIVFNMKQNYKLSSLRDTLLPKLMSGQIDVSSVSLRGIK